MKNFNILIAPNSFKECADSVVVTNLIENSLKTYLSKTAEDKIVFTKKPISDGGDGFIKVCTDNLNLIPLMYIISSPYDDTEFACEVAYSPKLKKIFIESANVLGLKLILEKKRKPLYLSSKGMGELLKQITEDVDSGNLKVDEVIIGIGGTGTNDLGLGVMQSFGLQLFDSAGYPLKSLPARFKSAAEVEWVKPQLPFSITSVIDVDNYLLGETGATRIFGPQKGATPEDVEILEEGFANILKLTGNNEKDKFISGAGGGLAAGLNLFLDAGYKFSKDFVREDLGICADDDYDLIITGEGSFDSQSLMNKGTMIVVNEFKQKKTKTFVICGMVEGDLKFGDNVEVIELIKFFSSPKESMENIEKGIDEACKEIAKQINF